MDNLFIIREKVRELYASHSKIFDKAIQFVVAFLTFYMINSNVGFMKMAASPLVTLALSVICTFLPMTLTVIAASALMLAHMFSVSLSVFIVTALVFLIMYIFYFRLAPKMALALLLTPIAFMLKIPYVIPVAYGLMSVPVSLAAISCGTIIYYIMQYVKKAAPGLDGKGGAGLLAEITAYLKQVFQNKEMWITVIAFIICLLVVYTLRRQAMDYAWKVATAAGVVVNIVVIAAGGIAMGVHTSYGLLFAGNIAAAVVGLILELFFFAVDYAKSENLQFEDDEYYYYVKAIPKLSVASPEKTVKKINERQETEIIDTADVRRKNQRPERAPKRGRGGEVPKKRPEAKKAPKARKHDMDEVNKMLLTQSLKQDLNIRD